jgi:hypothetical protein
MRCIFLLDIGFNILLIYMGLLTIFLSVYYGLWGVVGIYEYYFNQASQTLYIKDRDRSGYIQL